MGCAGGARQPAHAALSALDGGRFVWVETKCIDGPLPLAALGFERELFTEVRGDRVMMTFDTRIPRDACRSLLIWEASYNRSRGVWDFLSPGSVSLPHDSACGVDEASVTGGLLGLAGDELEVLTYRSPWCRGFDARSVYRRVAPRRLDDQAQIWRYFAHFNRRDASALARLFSPDGVLIEPFSRTPDGTFKRHVGRAAIEAWFVQAFHSTTWSGLRLRELHRAGEEGATWVAMWDYMDAALSEPIIGRNLFVLADGEIFMTELQLVTMPEPAEPPADEQADEQLDAPSETANP